MTTPRYWIPDRATPDTIIYRRCYRCGIDVEPKTGQRRQCRDCNELDKCAKRDALIERTEELWREGLSQRAIARDVGVSHATVAKWVAELRFEFPDVLELSVRDYPGWVGREIRVDARRQLQGVS